VLIGSETCPEYTVALIGPARLLAKTVPMPDAGVVETASVILASVVNTAALAPVCRSCSELHCAAGGAMSATS
jgi:hypothetical protein